MIKKRESWVYFNAIDTNGDGQISLKEASDYLKINLDIFNGTHHKPDW